MLYFGQKSILLNFKRCELITNENSHITFISIIFYMYKESNRKKIDA